MDLNKDGLILDIYHLLWKSEDFMKAGSESFKLTIPQTLIIKGSQPFAWYFTDSLGYLRKRRMKNLNLTEILNVFGANKHDSDVVAYFLHQNKFTNHQSFSSTIFFSVSLKKIVKKMSKKKESAWNIFLHLSSVSIIFFSL